jgi:hypothetical protein
MTFVAFEVFIAFIRLTELIALCSDMFHIIMILAVLGASISLVLKPPDNLLGTIRRYMLIIMVMWQLKKEMDGDLSSKIKLKGI